MSDHPVWQVPGGTAWAIAPRLAVTAAHVVDRLPSVFEIRSGDRVGHARVRAVEAEYDIAVLDIRLDEPLEPAPCGLPTPGRKATIRGWPDFASDAPVALEGTLSMAAHGACVLEVSGDVLARRSWTGLSGAPVWVDDRVVGVATHIHPARSLVRVCEVETFNEMFPPHLQPLRARPGTDPRRGQLLTIRNELLRGATNRGLALVGYAGFEPRRFGRALAGLVADQADACLVLQSGSLGGSEPSVAARLLRAIQAGLRDTPHIVDVPTRGSDSLRVQIFLEGLVERLGGAGRRLVLHLQGLSHIATDEVIQLGNLLAVVCQHEGFRIMATGGDRLRELHALEFEQHSAFHEIAYPILEGLKPHECDRLTDRMGIAEGWLWTHTSGHPALCRELAELIERGTPPDEALGALMRDSDYLAASRVRVRRGDLGAGCARLVVGGGAIANLGYDRELDELMFLGLVRREVDRWVWSAPMLQRWAAALG